jgi:hypothetical protein
MDDEGDVLLWLLALLSVSLVGMMWLLEYQ